MSLVVPQAARAGPCEPSRRLRPGDHPGRAFRIDRSHAGFPQGLIDATNLILSVVASWLTNAIDRIVKEQLIDRGTHASDIGITIPDLNRLRFATSHPPTPSAGEGYLWQLAPAVVLALGC